MCEQDTNEQQARTESLLLAINELKAVQKIDLPVALSFFFRKNRAEGI